MTAEIKSQHTGALGLSSIVGLVESADAALEKVVKDCCARPSDDSPRTVQIKITVTPCQKTTRNGIISQPKFEHEVKSGIVEKESDYCSLAIRANGNHLLATLVSSADDPNQMTIEDIQ